jgi:FIST C domain
MTRRTLILLAATALAVLLAGCGVIQQDNGSSSSQDRSSPQQQFEAANTNSAGACTGSAGAEGALANDRDWMRYAISLALTFKAPIYMKDEEYVVRGVPGVKMADGSIVVQSEVQEGSSVWLSSRDKEKISTGFDRMAAQIKEQLEGEKPKLVFQFECLTRGKSMFRKQEKLQVLQRFRQSVGPDVPWAGFYTIGEIGPVEKHNLRHLYTSVVLALR